MIVLFRFVLVLPPTGYKDQPAQLAEFPARSPHTGTYYTGLGRHGDHTLISLATDTVVQWSLPLSTPRYPRKTVLYKWRFPFIRRTPKKFGNQVIWLHFWCFGCNLDVIFLMCLMSSGLPFKPTSSSSIILINPI